MNTQFFMKASLIAAIAAASMAPAASQASNKKGLNACIDTFVKEHVPQGHPIRIVKRTQPRSMYMSVSSPETFQVHAKGAQTGDSFGSATCVVDRNGEVLAMRVQGSSIRLAKGITATDASGG